MRPATTCAEGGKDTEAPMASRLREGPQLWVSERRGACSRGHVLSFSLTPRGSLASLAPCMSGLRFRSFLVWKNSLVLPMPPPRGRSAWGGPGNISRQSATVLLERGQLREVGRKEMKRMRWLWKIEKLVRGLNVCVHKDEEKNDFEFWIFFLSY